ncbi:hypothetical protein [Streptomyces sp. NPDC053048]|uniref:hypothetical protein n=1 Tax=Streptomyces sp. NPDC053048 TaxID=3365694 RepID=UPI0037D7E1D3
MNIRRSVVAATATVMLGSGLAMAAPATAAPAAPAADSVSAQVQDSWTKVWQSTISGDYMASHGKWYSQGYKQPNGSRMARGVFTCWGGGEATLTVWNMDTGKKGKKTHRCDGVRHHTPVVGYQNGETVKLLLKGKKKTRVEAWAGR